MRTNVFNIDHQTKLNQTKSNQTKPNQTKLKQTKKEQTKPNKPKQKQTKTNKQKQTKTKTNQNKQRKTNQNKNKPKQTKKNKPNSTYLGFTKTQKQILDRGIQTLSPSFSENTTTRTYIVGQSQPTSARRLHETVSGQGLVRGYLGPKTQTIYPKRRCGEAIADIGMDGV